MEQLYKKNILLWLEDQESEIEVYALALSISDRITSAFGGKIIYRFSKIKSKVEPQTADEEINRLIKESNETPSLINLRTAQLGLSFLEKYIPTAIVSDSNFPMNGSIIMGWLSEKGFSDYPLTGFSGSDYNNLPEEYKKTFATTSARYITKRIDSLEEVINHVILSKMYNDTKFSS